MAASHDEKQPLILDTVVGLIKADTNKTYAHTSNELGAWCSGASIRRLFVKSGVRMYADIPIPNLSVDQLNQRRRFGEKVVKQFYGLPSRQPILDIHYKSMVGTTILEMDCIATSGRTSLIATKALD